MTPKYLKQENFKKWYFFIIGVSVEIHPIANMPHILTKQGITTKTMPTMTSMVTFDTK